jgi:hypothetical protein
MPLNDQDVGKLLDDQSLTSIGHSVEQPISIGHGIPQQLAPPRGRS